MVYLSNLMLSLNSLQKNIVNQSLVDVRSKEKRQSGSIKFETNVDLTVASKALMNKGSGAISSNLNGGRMSLNKNNTNTNLITSTTTNNNNNDSHGFNDYFDAKFDSFVTPSKDSGNKMADLSNTNSKFNTQPIATFDLDDANDGFADFCNANVFKATGFTTNNNLQFESAFQPCNPTVTSSITTTATTIQQPKLSTTDDYDSTKNGGDKIATKFRNDYSKTDQFETDIEEVLKRSLVDQ